MCGMLFSHLQSSIARPTPLLFRRSIADLPARSWKAWAAKLFVSADRIHECMRKQSSERAVSALLPMLTGNVCIIGTLRRHLSEPHGAP